MKYGFLFITILLGFFGQAQQRPPFQVLRFEENYDFLYDSLMAKNQLDRLKNIRIGQQSTFSFGGEITQTFEYVSQPYAQQIEDAYWLNRLMVNTQYRFNNNWRVFGEVASGTIKGRNGGPRVIDRDDLYVLNLFAEYKTQALRLRLGRQELTYGGENLISIRNGTNVRYAFDGVSFSLKDNATLFESFAATFVNTSPKAFDNKAFDVDGDLVWGLSVTQALKNSRTNFSVYYMGMKDELAFYEQFVGSVNLHSFGFRIHNEQNPFGYTLAGVYQIGKANSLDIRGFQLAAIGRYAIAETPLSVEVNGYLSSGDRNSSDQIINTFSPYFPQQSSFRGAMATRIFPSNVVFLSPRFNFNLYPFILTFDAGFLWKHRNEEGLFIPGGFPAYQAENSQSKFLGSQYGFTLVNVINHYLSMVMIYSHFDPQGYFSRQPNPGQVDDFFILKGIFKF